MGNSQFEFFDKIDPAFKQIEGFQAKAFELMKSDAEAAITFSRAAAKAAQAFVSDVQYSGKAGKAPSQDDVSKWVNAGVEAIQGYQSETVKAFQEWASATLAPRKVLADEAHAEWSKRGFGGVAQASAALKSLADFNLGFWRHASQAIKS